MTIVWDLNLEMVAIPGGKFLMGTAENEEGANDDEYPQHEVTVPPFYMSRYPITQEQWRKVASRTDLKTKNELSPDPSYFKGDNKPVENVSWNEAVEFCARLSKLTGGKCRLPSEAEWEYACRAGTTTPFYFGERIKTDLVGCERTGTTHVGKFPSNAFGLYDMHGNVWEWCLDNWHENYEDLYPIRGGSWLHPSCHSACRSRHFACGRNYTIGLRVVCLYAS